MTRIADIVVSVRVGNERGRPFRDSPHRSIRSSDYRYTILWVVLFAPRLILR